MYILYQENGNENLTLNETNRENRAVSAASAASSASNVSDLYNSPEDEAMNNGRRETNFGMDDHALNFLSQESLANGRASTVSGVSSTPGEKTSTKQGNQK